MNSFAFDTKRQIFSAEFLLSENLSTEKPIESVLEYTSENKLRKIIKNN